MKVNIGFEIVSAKSKKPSDDAPTGTVPMRANGEAIRRNPSTDQKKVRRQMSKSAGQSSTECPKCGTKIEPIQYLNGGKKILQANCKGCGWKGTKVKDASKTAAEVGSGAPDHFNADIERLNKALDPWLVRDGDEIVGISPDAPADLLRMYHDLTSAGYANGWMASLKENDMTMHDAHSLAQLEARILGAMASASTREQQRALGLELEEIRAKRRQAVRDARDTDIANAVIRDHLTPVLVHSMHTHATDWLDEVTPDDDEPHQAMRTAASLWFQKTSADVRADVEEFNEQAAGMARRHAGRYGERFGEAVQAFMDTASFLHRRYAAGDDTSSVENKNETSQGDSAGTHSADTPDGGEHVGPKDECPICDPGPTRQEREDSDAVHGTAGSPMEKGSALNFEGEFLFEADGGGLGIEFGPACPKCHSEATASAQDNWVCRSCGHEWPKAEKTAAGQSGNAESGLPLEPKGDRESFDSKQDGWVDYSNEGSDQTSEVAPVIQENKDGSDSKRNQVDASRTAVLKQARALSEIANEIRKDWGSNVNYAAKPYLDAMRYMGEINENFGSDSGKSIVSYFLSNASSWRGETAKRVKAELKAMLAGKASAKTAYAEGDKAKCHKDGEPIEFFDGAWYHLSGGPSHNDVYPPNKSERNEVNSSRRTAGHAYDNGDEIGGGWGDNDVPCKVCGKKANDPEHLFGTDGRYSKDSQQHVAETAAEDWPIEGDEHGQQNPNVESWPGHPNTTGDSQDLSQLPGVASSWVQAVREAGSPLQVDWGQSMQTFASEPIADESGQAQSDLDDVEVGSKHDRPMWPWEIEEQEGEGGSVTAAVGEDAADVDGVRTPGGEAGYPQPEGESADGNSDPEWADKKAEANLDNLGDSKAPPFGKKDDEDAEAKQAAFRARVQANLKG